MRIVVPRIVSLCALAIGLSLVPPATWAAEPTAAQRRAFTLALESARLDPSGRWKALASGLEDYPLWPYLPYHALARDLDRADPTAVEAYLVRYEGTLPANQLRSRWLARLAARRDWPRFLAAWRPQNDTALRCRHVEAQVALGPKEHAEREALSLWETGASLPTDCDNVVRWLRHAGLLGPTRVWQRLALAAEARNPSLMRTLSGFLPAPAAAEGLRYASWIADPNHQLAHAGRQADTERARTFLTTAVVLLARRDADLAGTHWLALTPRFAFSDTQRSRAIGAIALNKAASYAADAALWMARIPGPADDGVREWRLREALARGDYAAARSALSELSTAQQLEPRFRWVRGRLLELDGQREAAAAVWDSLSGEANFHGFLAADRLHRPYAICLRTPDGDATERARVAALPGLARALEFHAIGEHDDARREWNHLLPTLTDAERPLAVELAMARGWTDRGPLTLLRPEEQRYYALRFPIAWQTEVDTHARRHGLDRGLVYGLIRAESAWVTDARSSADARGLMQLLHAPARRLARLEKLPYSRPADLYRPPLAIALGTRHLAEDLARWDDRVWLAAAAYNAGPTPVRRWLDARGTLPPDLWIETIPYRETREYVARVIAFATLYEWRLGGPIRRVSERVGMPEAAGSAASVACNLTTTAAPARAAP